MSLREGRGGKTVAGIEELVGRCDCGEGLIATDKQCECCSKECLICEDCVRLGEKMCEACRNEQIHADVQRIMNEPMYGSVLKFSDVVKAGVEAANEIDAITKRLTA